MTEWLSECWGPSLSPRVPDTDGVSHWEWLTPDCGVREPERWLTASGGTGPLTLSLQRSHLCYRQLYRERCPSDWLRSWSESVRNHHKVAVPARHTAWRVWLCLTFGLIQFRDEMRCPSYLRFGAQEALLIISVNIYMWDNMICISYSEFFDE